MYMNKKLLFRVLGSVISLVAIAQEEGVIKPQLLFERGHPRNAQGR